MKGLILFLTVISLAHATEDRFRSSLNPISAAKVGFRTCYRWMSGFEMKMWHKRGPQLLPLNNERQWLGRDGEIGKGVYCWHNPAGAIRGGIYENYGENLVRIDLVDDVVLYNRSSDSYSTANFSPVPEDMKKGLDSEVFYANYKQGFQEYLIKDLRAIKGFTFNDPALRDEFLKNYDLFEGDGLPATEVHDYFTSWCPSKSVKEDSRYALRAQNDKRYICWETRETMKKRKAHMEKLWETTSEEWVPNPEARGPLKISLSK